MQVLIVKTSSMGDVLHTLPALTDACDAIPGIRFDWVVEEGFAQIPGWHTSVNRVIPVAIRRWRKAWFSSAVTEERHAFHKQIQSVQYDAVIDAQGLLKSAALVTRLARGPRHGMDWRSAREPLACLFYQHRHTIARQQHAVERTRELFAKSLNYEKPHHQGDYAIAQHFQTQTVRDTEQYIVCLHATTRDDKHWPELRWLEFIQLMRGTGCKIKLPWGAEHERLRAEKLAQGNPHVEVLPKLSLEEVAKVLAGACAVVSVDTGLSHLTAALDRPNITLFGPTDPALIGGYGKNQHQIISKTREMADISASQVLSTLWELHLPFFVKP